jgi:hypothetical protein
MQGHTNGKKSEKKICCTELQCPYILSPEQKHKYINTKAGRLWSEKHYTFYLVPSRVLTVR